MHAIFQRMQRSGARPSLSLLKTFLKLLSKCVGMLEPQCSQELCRRMGAAGREYAASTPWEDNAARVLELYDEVLGASRG